MMACMMSSPNDNGSLVLWVALVECIPASHNAELFDGGKGAFINVVGWARSKESFSTKIEEELARRSARMIALEDVEPFEDRADGGEIGVELQNAAAKVENDGELSLATLDIYMGADG